MKFSKLILATILKSGILYESDNCDMDIEIPVSQLGMKSKGRNDKILVNIKADNIRISIDKV